MPLAQKLMVACLCLLLGGCYETTEPILDTGDRASISGTFRCVGMMDNRVETFTETSSGWFNPDYRYNTRAGDRITLRKRDKDHYIAQIQTGSSFTYAFIKVISKNAFNLMFPDLMRFGHQLDGFARAANVQTYTSPNNRDYIRLVGNTASTRTYLDAHTPEQLTTIMECRRE